MYNRYIPQPDGSFQRSQVQDHSRPSENKQPMTCQQQPQQVFFNTPPTVAEVPCCNHCPRTKPVHPPISAVKQKTIQNSGITHFLKHLLPKEFDIEDLLVVLLLLLMAGDCQEDQNTALLTLVLYLFL